jgi:hypothetical protein
LIRYLGERRNASENFNNLKNVMKDSKDWGVITPR